MGISLNSSRDIHTTNHHFSTTKSGSSAPFNLSTILIFSYCPIPVLERKVPSFATGFMPFLPSLYLHTDSYTVDPSVYNPGVTRRSRQNDPDGAESIRRGEKFHSVLHDRSRMAYRTMTDGLAEAASLASAAANASPDNAGGPSLAYLPYTSTLPPTKRSLRMASGLTWTSRTFHLEPFGLLRAYHVTGATQELHLNMVQYTVKLLDH
jgi:hypothetical protein